MNKYERITLITFMTFFCGIFAIPSLMLLTEVSVLGFSAIYETFFSKGISYLTLSAISFLFLTALSYYGLGYTFYIVATGKEWR